MNVIREELKHLKTGPRDLRKFGLMIGGVFLALGLWFVFRQKPWHGWFWMPGGLLMVLGSVAPKTLKPVYIAWMSLAFVMGLIASTLLLTVFYYLVVTPIGLVARACGKDFLERKFTSVPSYWVVRMTAMPTQPKEYEQQF